MNASTINWRGVIRGAVLAAIIGATASILANYVSDDQSTNFALTIILLAGLVLGGFAAGREAPTYAYTNGGLASFLAFAVVETIGIVIKVAQGQASRLNPFNIVFIGILSVSCGVVGGAIAASAEQRKQASREGESGDHRGQEGTA